MSSSSSSTSSNTNDDNIIHEMNTLIDEHPTHFVIPLNILSKASDILLPYLNQQPYNNCNLSTRLIHRDGFIKDEEVLILNLLDETNTLSSDDSMNNFLIIFSMLEFNHTRIDLIILLLEILGYHTSNRQKKNFVLWGGLRIMKRLIKYGSQNNLIGLLELIVKVNYELPFDRDVISSSCLAYGKVINDLESIKNSKNLTEEVEKLKNKWKEKVKNKEANEITPYANNFHSVYEPDLLDMINLMREEEERKIEEEEKKKEEEEKRKKEEEKKEKERLKKEKLEKEKLEKERLENEKLKSAQVPSTTTSVPTPTSTKSSTQSFTFDKPTISSGSSAPTPATSPRPPTPKSSTTTSSTFPFSTASISKPTQPINQPTSQTSIPSPAPSPAPSPVPSPSISSKPFDSGLESSSMDFADQIDQTEPEKKERKKVGFGLDKIKNLPPKSIDNEDNEYVEPIKKFEGVQKSCLKKGDSKKKKVRWNDIDGSGQLREVQEFFVPKIKQSTTGYKNYKDLAKKEREGENLAHHNASNFKDVDEESKIPTLTWKKPPVLQLPCFITENFAELKDLFIINDLNEIASTYPQVNYLDDSLIPSDPGYEASLLEKIHSKNSNPDQFTETPWFISEEEEKEIKSQKNIDINSQYSYDYEYDYNPPYEPSTYEPTSYSSSIESHYDNDELIRIYVNNDNRLVFSTLPSEFKQISPAKRRMLEENYSIIPDLIKSSGEVKMENLRIFESSSSIEEFCRRLGKPVPSYTNRGTVDTYPASTSYSSYSQYNNYNNYPSTTPLIPSSVSAPFSHSKSFQRICTFFNSPQGCRNGVNCTFSHIRDPSAGKRDYSKVSDGYDRSMKRPLR